MTGHGFRGLASTILNEHEFDEAHIELQLAHTNQPRQVIGAAHQLIKQQAKEPEQKTLSKEAVTFARDSIFEREAVADERAILRDGLRRGMGEASYRDIRAEFDSRREAGEFRTVQGMKYDSARSFTTPETIAAERFTSAMFGRAGTPSSR